ncbi:hypothetical protein BU23DRAFT_243660 [Bimuria novae-zelandiae CBS 107.79]|uniref:F-box domain-containing protein n=1 Tax=Bimuria novae-zelandiae CBS 107.79 TaxID=1447943 RepID=A0A6A5UVF5_9PLEO|nr:hypothetical protein BU23DRAFT_243660 [Bimuria novae-zelandiae CBS 107.79]
MPPSSCPGQAAHNTQDVAGQPAPRKPPPKELLELPNEVIDRILSNVPTRDLLTVVSKFKDLHHHALKAYQNNCQYRISAHVPPVSTEQVFRDNYDVHGLTLRATGLSPVALVRLKKSRYNFAVKRAGDADRLRNLLRFIRNAQGRAAEMRNLHLEYRPGSLT